MNTVHTMHTMHNVHTVHTMHTMHTMHRQLIAVVRALMVFCWLSAEGASNCCWCRTHCGVGSQWRTLQCTGEKLSKCKAVY